MIFRLVISCIFPVFILISCGRDSLDAPGTGIAPGDTIVLKIAANGSIDHPYNKGMEKFKEVLEAETNGIVTVNVFPNAQLGSEEDQVNGIKLGTIDATVVAAGNLAPFVPEIELFNLPFIFNNLDHFYRVLDGPVGEWIGKAIEKNTNSIFLNYWTFGTRNTWNAIRPILTPEDLKGLKIRVMGSPILLDSFNAFGAQATNMGWGEFYSALQQGVLDGGETSVVDMYFEKFYEVSRYVSLTNHMIGAAPFFFSKKKYDSLPGYVQIAILKAGREAAFTAREAEKNFTAEAFIKLKEYGIEFNEVDLDPFRDRVKSVYEKYAEQLGGMKIIEQIGMQ